MTYLRQWRISPAVASRLTTVVETPAYLSKSAKVCEDDERSAVVDELAANPEAGTIIKGTGGLRKLRIALPGRGKRGGARVIYWYHSERYPVVLLWVFAKNEADDLTAKQRKQLVAATSQLLDDFGGEQ